MIAYGKQTIDDTDIKAVVDALGSDWLTTGPRVAEFEEKFAAYVGSKYAVAVSSGTAALHLSCLAAGLREGDELITSPMTFVASANCALYCGAVPVFSDIKEESGVIDENILEEKVTSKTKIIIPIHYAGLPCNMKKIKQIANRHGLIVIEDACHALGAEYKKTKIGSCTYSDMSVFSFHPVKHITTGEGGMITTNSEEIYRKLIQLRGHGITKNPNEVEGAGEGSWYYEMQDLGFNYRITDFQCALGISQLKRIKNFVNRRREIAEKYDEEFSTISDFEIVKDLGERSAYHLYVIKTSSKEIRLSLFNFLKDEGIACQVHYIPVHWHPYYKNLGYKKEDCQKAGEFYERIISLPIYPGLSDEEIDKVVSLIKKFYEG